jgi:molecular chaperone GrpE
MSEHNQKDQPNNQCESNPQKECCGGGCHDEVDDDATVIAAHPDQSQIAALTALAEKYKNDFLYLRADFDNYKKNSIKERSEYLKYGSERIIVELLNVIDNFERALLAKVSQENFGNFVKGVEMTAKDLRAILDRFGVTEVPAYGKPFDPAVHEALSSEDTKEMPAGNVLRVFKKPYKLHDKLIRPGQVVVAKTPAQ